MKSPAGDIASFLVAAGHGVLGANTGWSMNVSLMPDRPNTAIAVYDTGGAEVDTDERDIFRPTIQVRVRAGDYRTAYDKIAAIVASMRPWATQTMNGALYIDAIMSSDILSIGQDQNDRPELTVNFRIIRQEM